ncbi:MAG: hypothetical protein FWC78_04250 [Defluviitaleaceae bacterium]|nr:hypothetical protein [Defluviitaleaceae bacterium]
MKKYIIINGGMGAGKSATGRRIAELLGRAAFIEGDFVVDMHPYVGYQETQAMQADNILHMSKNYYNFGKCDNVVLSWIMGESNATSLIIKLAKLGFQVHHFMLTSSKEALTERWKNDKINDWRTDKNLTTALDLLEKFSKHKNCTLIDTSSLTVDMAARAVIEKVNHQ